MGYFMLTAGHELTKKKKDRRILVMHLVYNGTQKFNQNPLWTMFGKVPEHYQIGIPDFTYSVSNFADFDDDQIKHLFNSLKVRAMVRLMHDIKDRSKILKSLEVAIIDLLSYNDDIGRQHFINAMLN